MPRKGLVTRQELAAMAREARGGRSQNDVADRLNVSQPAISKAERNMDASLDGLRIKIIEEYTNYRVEKPTMYFKITEKS